MAANNNEGTNRKIQYEQKLPSALVNFCGLFSGAQSAETSKVLFTNTVRNIHNPLYCCCPLQASETLLRHLALAAPRPGVRLDTVEDAEAIVLGLKRDEAPDIQPVLRSQPPTRPEQHCSCFWAWHSEHLRRGLLEADLQKRAEIPPACAPLCLY